jgi:hypothetical protein
MKLSAKLQLRRTLMAFGEITISQFLEGFEKHTPFFVLPSPRLCDSAVQILLVAAEPVTFHIK